MLPTTFGLDNIVACPTMLSSLMASVATWNRAAGYKLPKTQAADEPSIDQTLQLHNGTNAHLCTTPSEWQ